MIVYGSINDLNYPAADVGAAARAYYQTIIDRLPGVSLAVVGPVWPRAVGGYQPIIDLNRAIKEAASGLAALFIDPLDPEWITGQRKDPASGNAAVMIGEDGTHPTPEGHVFIACKIASAMMNAGLDLEAT